VAVRGGRRRGDDAHVDALFRQTGVIRVESLEQLFDAASVLARAPLPVGRRVGVVSSAGGAGLLAADAADGAGLEVCDVVELPVEASPDAYRGAVARQLTGDDVDAVLLVLTPPLRDQAAQVGVALSSLAQASAKPVVAALLTADGGVTTGAGPRRDVRRVAALARGPGARAARRRHARGPTARRRRAGRGADGGRARARGRVRAAVALRDRRRTGDHRGDGRRGGLLLRVGRLVDDLPEVAHLRLDPVVVTGSGAVVVGVEARLAPWLPRPELALRRMREPA
jgi:acyl-CoA synthetase (NDP forming)